MQFLRRYTASSNRSRPSGPNPGGDSNTGAGYYDADYEVVDDDNNKK
jgi:hypothetical protein